MTDQGRRSRAFCSSIPTIFAARTARASAGPQSATAITTAVTVATKRTRNVVKFLMYIHTYTHTHTVILASWKHCYWRTHMKYGTGAYLASPPPHFTTYSPTDSKYIWHTPFIITLSSYTHSPETISEIYKGTVFTHRYYT